MADFRNHRRFTLKCIKASITLVSCKLKKPLKTRKSYNIIQKVEKQLLYERIRNINNTLEALKEQQKRQYSQFKDALNMLNMSNLHVQDADPEWDLDRCRLFINKMKEHRHNKTKRRQINKFNCLFLKKYEYHHNLTRQSQSLKNIDTPCTLSGHQNMPSSCSSNSTQTSSNPAVPATPMAPTPSTSTDSTTAPSVAPGLPPSNSRDTCKTSDCTQQMGNQSVQNPLHNTTVIATSKRTLFCHYPQIPP